MNELLLPLSHLLARFGFWYPTILALSLTGPLDQLDETARGRLLYALMMTHGSRPARRLFARILRRDVDRDAETNLWLAAAAQTLHRPRLAAFLCRRTLKQPHTPNQLAAARALSLLFHSIAHGEIAFEIAAKVDELKLQPHEPLVLVVASEPLLPLFDLWLQQAKKFVSGRILAVALDQPAAKHLAQSLSAGVLDLSPYFVFGGQGKIHDRSRNALWILRVLLLREFVSRGHTLLSIDLDAIVLADLDTKLRSLPDADIIAQQDYSIPMDVARKLGFVLCCGFVFLRPTPPVLAILDRYVQQTIYELDDQTALNHLIAEAGISDQQTTSTYFSFRCAGVLFACPDQSLVSRDIAYGNVVRHFQQQGQPVSEIRKRLGL